MKFDISYTIDALPRLLEGATITVQVALLGFFFSVTLGTFIVVTRNTLNWRIQPFMNTSLSLNYDHIDLGDDFSSENLWLIRPKIDFTFTKNIFWTSYVQFSSQSENLGINSRFQWRFAPLSDLYIVYNLSLIHISEPTRPY